jgi:hypothetical protein
MAKQSYPAPKSTWAIRSRLASRQHVDVAVQVDARGDENTCANEGVSLSLDRRLGGCSIEAVVGDSGWYSIAVESGSADNLATITGGVSGDRLAISPSSDGVTITVNDSRNIKDLTGNECVLNSAADTLSLVIDGTDWMEIGRNTP